MRSVRIAASSGHGSARLAALFAVVLSTLIAATARPAAAQAPPPDEPDRVVVIFAPRLTWDLVERYQPANLVGLFEQSAVAMNSVRTIGPITSTGEAYMTIGAGNRMTSDRSIDGDVVDRSETIERGDPTVIWQRMTGLTADGNAVALGKAAVDRRNELLSFGAVSGSLGEALHRDGLDIAVIGNADTRLGRQSERHVGLAGMDGSGQLRAGSVSATLLAGAEEAPFGLELDLAVTETTIDRALRDQRVTMLELSDLERAESFRGESTPEQGDRLYENALAHDDLLVGMVLDRLDLERDLVMVVAPTAPAPESVLTAFSIAGRGVDVGWATSSTTRRDGYVSLTDVAPTILGRLGVDVPESMGDTRITSVAESTSFPDRLDDMVRHSERALARDHAFGPLSVTFIVVLLLNLGLASLCLARIGQLALAVRGLSLLVVAVLPASFLVGLIPTSAMSVPAAAVLVFGTAAVLAFAAWLVGRTRGRLPIVLLVGLLWLVLAVDIATGGNLQIDTIFGYSPIVAGRFAGFGNAAFSMFSLSAILAASAFVESREGRPSRWAWSTTAAVGAFFAVTVILDGHPAFGSDVGGVLAFVPAAAVFVLVSNGVRIRVRTALLIAGSTVALLAVFAMIDLARPPESQTHLGRFVTKLADGQAGEIVSRKLQANVSVLGAAWTWVVPIALVYIAYLTWRPNQTLATIGERYPQFRPFGVAALTLGLLAMGLNDSGVSMPAMMLAIAISFVTYMVMEVERPRLAAAEEATDGGVVVVDDDPESTVSGNV